MRTRHYIFTVSAIIVIMCLNNDDKITRLIKSMCKH